MSFSPLIVLSIACACIMAGGFIGMMITVFFKARADAADNSECGAPEGSAREN
jgi:hypothetical protein